jgi:hypothetical protein
MRSLERQLLKRDLKIRNSKQNQRLLKKRIRILEPQLQSAPEYAVLEELEAAE